MTLAELVMLLPCGRSHNRKKVMMRDTTGHEYDIEIVFEDDKIIIQRVQTTEKKEQ